MSRSLLDIYKSLSISEKIAKLAVDAEEQLKEKFIEIDSICLENTIKVMNAFKNNKVSETHFRATTGYGYDDVGREVIEKVYSDIFKAEDALVRIQFVNGTHTLSTVLFGNLKTGDTLLSITGAPYDTLAETIGIVENNMSLISNGVKYKQIELKDNEFDYDNIKEYLIKNKVNIVFIGRSSGYSTRKSQSISNIQKVIKLIKSIDQDIIVIVDNCYGEFVEEREPIEAGADIVAGSLIKNIGGGICETGGYVVGKKKCVESTANRLTAPGIGKECGATLGKNKEILQGLFVSPSVVNNALKTAIFTSKVLESLGYDVSPASDEQRTDIIEQIIFNDKAKLIRFIQTIQKESPIDSYITPEKWSMPGYSDEIIMAAGTFVSGASIELSADAPIKEPYIAYIQGGLTFESAKISILKAIDKTIEGE